jgi:hypothetical protein
MQAGLGCAPDPPSPSADGVGGTATTVSSAIPAISVAILVIPKRERTRRFRRVADRFRSLAMASLPL